MLVGSTTRRVLLERMGVAAGLAIAIPGLALAQEAPPVEAPPEPDLTPALIDSGRSKHEHVTVPVLLNGAGPYRFMVDTGANTSCVSARLAEALGLPQGRRLRVHTIVGPKERASVMIEHLQIGARARRKVEAPVLPMTNFEVDGVLGVDWLKGQRLVLGFKHNKLEITKSRQDVTGSGRVVVPARRKSGQLTIVDADLNGRPISAMIDSGSQFSVGNAYLRRLVEEQDATAHERLVKVGITSIAGESLTGDQLNLPFMRLGGLNLGNVPVVFADLPVFKLWDLHKTPTIMLGMDLLTQFTTVAVDFGRSSVRFDVESA